MSVDVRWCPFADYAPIHGHDHTGPMTGGAAKILHHTTESDSIAGAEATYEQTGNLPHFTDSFELGTYKVHQHLPLDQYATALKHPAGSGETNRDNVIQIEHVGHTATSNTWASGYLDGIGILCRWIELQTGCMRVSIAPFVPGARRLSWGEWEGTSGHLGHMHCPGNDHVDPGAMDIGHVLNAGRPAPAPIPEPVVEDDMPKVATDPATGDFWVLTGPDGGVDARTATGAPSARYYGNLLDHPQYNAGEGKPLGPAIDIAFWPPGQPVGGQPAGGYVIYTRAPDGSYHPYHFDATTLVSA